MGIFNEFNKKEKPVFTGLHFGFGSSAGGGISEVAQTDYIVGSGGVVQAGIASAVDGYTYHTFVTPGTFTWTGGDTNSVVEILLVGGGGGGGDARTGGGGGAGQVVQSINYAAPSANASSGITITVGSGGAAITGTPVTPAYGGDTIVNSPVGIITAKGGGYGGIDGVTSGVGGKDGGSQGGARSNSSHPLTFPGSSFGYPLGETYDYPSDGVAADYLGNNYANWATPSVNGSGQHGGSGGGGAHGVGKVGIFPGPGNVSTQPTWIPAPGFPGQGYAHPTNTSTRAFAGAGGDGLRLHTYRAQNLLPSSHPYYPLMSQMDGYYGGGGGGGTCDPVPNADNQRCPGGRGGGAPGSNQDDTLSCPGMDGTGGGGGGGGEGAGGGSAGGKGICVVRYKTNTTQITGGSVFTDGGNTFHVFTESGIFEVPDSSPKVGSSFNALMVGGGGGGGSYNGGGGGAGRYRNYPGNTLAAGRMAVVIGQGGRGAVDFYRNPNTQANFNERGPWSCGGQATYIVNGTAVGMPGDSIIAGGGAGGGSNSYDNDGSPAPGTGATGGSGGGGCDQGGPGPGTQSNGGGAPSDPAAGGGGGGHAQNGSNSSSGSGGAGGNGTGTPWIPSNLPTLFGDPSAPLMYHAGGGGGGDRSGSGGAGGDGGGGNGRGNETGFLAQDGQYATGGGGGGAEGGSACFGGAPIYATFARGIGGDGGSGVMIISYAT